MASSPLPLDSVRRSPMLTNLRETVTGNVVEVPASAPAVSFVVSWLTSEGLLERRAKPAADSGMSERFEGQVKHAMFMLCGGACQYLSIRTLTTRTPLLVVRMTLYRGKFGIVNLLSATAVGVARLPLIGCRRRTSRPPVRGVSSSTSFVNRPTRTDETVRRAPHHPRRPRAGSSVPAPRHARCICPYVHLVYGVRGLCAMLCARLLRAQALARCTRGGQSAQTRRVAQECTPQCHGPGARAA